MGVVRTGCGHPGHKVHGWMSGWTELTFHADANSGKLRITLIIFGWLCGQEWAWDFNFNEWMNLADFLHANAYLRKLKVGQIWLCPLRSWDSIICCISRMNEWIELIFCMLIHGVRKAKSYFGYAHGQIWLWPFRSRDS